MTYPGYYHNDLRVDPSIVPAYLLFVEAYGQRLQRSCPRLDPKPPVPSP